MRSASSDLLKIFQAGLARVDPYKMMIDHIHLEGDRLVVAFDDQRHEVDLGGVSRILVLGGGKASVRMARAVEAILGDRIGGGLIATKYGHAEPLSHIEVIEAGHPGPDANSVLAARRLMELASAADEHCLIITLISGGGSALLCAPFEDPHTGTSLSLGEQQAINRELLASGADIGEINCLRKHLSAIKGGRLLQLMAPARSLNFILSDVVGDRLDTIASGLTSPDETSFAQALAVIDKYALKDKVPATALRILTLGAEGRIAETVKLGDPATALASNILIGTNLAALLAARDKGRALGYHCAVLTSAITGEAREVAKVLYGIARDVRGTDLLVRKPALVIAGGETVVRLHGTGKGGRNQEMALAFLAELAKDELGGRGITFLSASTDGSDGPTDAAGAYASAEGLAAAQAAGLSIDAFLANNDSYSFFDTIGQLVKTGPTMTNVCDLHMVLIS
jgi:hydroxypyruvate reductase